MNNTIVLEFYHIDKLLLNKIIFFSEIMLFIGLMILLRSLFCAIVILRQEYKAEQIAIKNREDFNPLKYKTSINNFKLKRNFIIISSCIVVLFMFLIWMRYFEQVLLIVEILFLGCFAYVANHLRKFAP